MENRIQQNLSSDNSNAGDKMTGINVATHIKYYLQFKQKNIHTPLPIDRISSKTFYRRHQKAFDKFAMIASKYSINVDKFSKFFIIDYCKSEYDINDSLVSQQSISEYVRHLQKIKKRNDIYNWVMKSIASIASECHKNNIVSAKDFIRKTISDKSLSKYYVSGIISKYYLAAIPNFNKIIPKLDHFSRLELDDLYRLFAIYQTEVNDAFLYMKNVKINPIRLTDLAIAKIQKQQTCCPGKL